MTVMKLEPKTVTVLKNFSSINPSMVFKPGDVVSTVSPLKTVLAKAKIPQSFERQFGIYDLSRFLGVISLFGDNPELQFNTDSVTIRSDNRELDYRFVGDITTIIAPPEGNVDFKEDVSFKITNAALQDIQRALSALSMPEIAVVGDGNKLWIQVIDTKNTSSHNYRINLGETDKKFRFVFKAENLKFIPQDYDVRITSKGMSHFKGRDVIEVDYWVAVQPKVSSFEG
jgi:hypothetical protein